MHWTEPTAWAVTLIALYGVHLNNNRRRACFCLWWISNAASFAIHADAQMIGMTARDVAFFILSVVGFYKWKRPTAASDTEATEVTDQKRGV